MKKNLFLNNFVEAGPLCLFLIYAGMVDTRISHNWLGPYLASSVLAIAVTMLLLYQKLLLNRLFLGIHAYLLSGSVGLLVHWDWLNHFYGKLQASGMLIWVVTIGLWTSFFSPAGFIGAIVSDRKYIVIPSIVLLLLSVTAFFVSYYFTGNRVMAELVPFMSLFLCQRYLRSRLVGH